MDFDWKGILKGIAPTLATAAGGPMAGTAVKFLAEKFLGNPDAGEEEIAAALQSATPEQLGKLREIDNAFKLEMKRIGVDVFKLEVEDKKSARDLFKVNIWPQIILSAIFITGYFFILYHVMTAAMTLDEGMKALVFTLIGVITGEVPRIMAFWFGSSMGSKEKTQKMK
jgi:hypothetical protein